MVCVAHLKLSKHTVGIYYRVYQWDTISIIMNNIKPHNLISLMTLINQFEMLTGNPILYLYSMQSLIINITYTFYSIVCLRFWFVYSGGYKGCMEHVPPIPIYGMLHHLAKIWIRHWFVSEKCIINYDVYCKVKCRSKQNTINW